jgi:hypothetical protein
MEKPRVAELELYHRGERWQFSVLLIPEARACGRLSVPPDASFAEASQDLVRRVEDWYGVTVSPDWQEQQPNWWLATVERT